VNFSPCYSGLCIYGFDHLSYVKWAKIVDKKNNNVMQKKDLMGVLVYPAQKFSNSLA